MGEVMGWGNWKRNVQKFEIFTAVVILVFWVVTMCFVDGYRRFGGTYCLPLKG
jgi:hypothetical protein